jgi:hypothetical protein
MTLFNLGKVFSKVEFLLALKGKNLMLLKLIMWLNSMNFLWDLSFLEGIIHIRFLEKKRVFSLRFNPNNLWVGFDLRVFILGAT